MFLALLILSLLSIVSVTTRFLITELVKSLTNLTFSLIPFLSNSFDVGPKDFPVVLKKIGSWFGSVKRYVSNLQNEMTSLEENSIEINNQTFDINNPSENEEKKVDKNEGK